MPTIKPKHALREHRLKQGWSVEEAARRLGVAESTLRSYENGNREVDGDVAKAIEEKLGCPRHLVREDLFAAPVTARRVAAR